MVCFCLLVSVAAYWLSAESFPAGGAAWASFDVWNCSVFADPSAALAAPIIPVVKVEVGRHGFHQGLALSSAGPLHSILRKEEEKKEKIHIYIHTPRSAIQWWIPDLARFRGAAEGVLGPCLGFSCLLYCRLV